MKKLHKQILGWFLLSQIIPVIGGLLSLDGKYHHNGKFFLVYPFWEVYGAFSFLMALCAILIGIILLIINYLILDDK